MAKSHDSRDEGHFNAALAKGIIKVGDGRGFVVECQGGRIVVTAAHCLPYLPPPDRASYTEERTYANLLGALDISKPSVWAECLFADPVADIAILGSPDTQALDFEAEAYGCLIEESVALQIGEPPKGGQAWMLGLDGNWYSCSMKWAYPASLLIEGQTRPGMSGSPIISDGGAAIALVSTGAVRTDSGGHQQTAQSSQPVLSYTLPRWSLKA
jgi:Trypsin-like peptidase domain